MLRGGNMFGRIEYKGEIYEGLVQIEKNVLTVDRTDFPIDEVRFLPPVEPSKIVCVGVNYLDHAGEMKHDIPEEPIIFMKPPSALVGHGDYIILPDRSKRVDYEGELAVVIGKKGKNIPAEEWREYVMGFTCFNDITARDLQKKDGQWTRSKSFDTFAPIGPWITFPESLDLRIVTMVNGEVKQSSRTSRMIFSVPQLIEFISGVMTLEKGDVIATGTPSGVGPLSKGDVVEVEIEGVGLLRNHVR